MISILSYGAACLEWCVFMYGLQRWKNVTTKGEGCAGSMPYERMMFFIFAHVYVAGPFAGRR